MRQRANHSKMEKNAMETDSFESLISDVQELLNNKVFVGTYTEKRYVESLQAYRNVIVVDQDDDNAKNLKLARQKIESGMVHQWIGITGDPQNPERNDCLLWVLLNDVPIGKHWFQISAIRFEAKEIILEVKHVQKYKSPDKTFGSNDINFPELSFKEIFTYSNMQEAIKFLTVLFMAIFAITIEILRYLGEYSIKLSHILVNFIQVSTPIFLGFFEFLTKCVGGLYWLLYVIICKPQNAPAVPAVLLNKNQRNYRPIAYGSRYSYDRFSNYSNYQRKMQ